MKVNQKAQQVSQPLPTEVLSYHDGYEAQNGTVVQYQPEWTKQHQLEGDGLLPLLYDHLWKSDRTREHRLRDVLIPDTVVFEHNFPRAWYTYDIKTQELVKRAGKLLDSQSIYKYFSTEEKGCDVVAQFYHKSVSVQVEHPYHKQNSPHRKKSPEGRQSGQSPRSEHHHPPPQDDEELTTAVEFFTKEKLFDFLHNRKTKPDGVLQKFLVPKGESSSRHNFQIQAVWSPLVTLVYKRTNKRRLNDKTVPVHQRSATFDGHAHFSSESLVADGTKTRIDDLCKTIVQHFLVTEHKQITRLVLYFKVDDLDRIWVLWASSLRIGSDKLNPSYLRVPMQLAMRVENVNGGSSREEVQSARKKMQRELVERDVDLYNLTGDWAFASQCAQKFDHDDAVENGSSPTRSTSPLKKKPLMIPQPPTAAAPNAAATAINLSTLSRLELRHADEFSDSAINVSHTRGPPSTYSARTHAERPVSARMYISPRAPFLPTVDKQCNSDVLSAHHPLHHAYALTHENADAQQQGNQTGQSSSGSGPKRAFNQSSPRGVAKPNEKVYTVKIKRSEQEKVIDALNSLAQDILYDAYSVTMEGPDPFHVKKFTMPAEIIKCLLPQEVSELANVLLIEQDTSVEEGNVFFVPLGKLGRGRRQDRPAAQISRDVTEYLERLFSDENTSYRIMSEWQQNCSA